MLFQYVGHGEDSPINCDVFDLHFVLNGEPVDVTNEFVIKKLIGNKSFKFEPVLVSHNSISEPITLKRGRQRK